MAEVVETALAQSLETSPEAQRRLLLPILYEDEGGGARGPARRRPSRLQARPPPRRGLVIRRERTADGWTLRFTGPEATGPLMEDIMDYVEQTFGRE